MRKRTKNKLHSCAMCKPPKMGGACRWSEKDLNALKTWEKEKQKILKSDSL